MPSFVSRWLTTLTIIGCSIGAGVGFICQAASAPAAVVRCIGFFGALWVRALKCLVVPMIFCSMISSVAGRPSATGAGKFKMSKYAVQYYSATTAIAALSGLLWFNAFSFAFAPLDMESRLPNSTAADTSEGDGGSMLDTLLNFGFDLVPDNLFEVLLHTELLGLITFAIFFASALDTRTESAAALLALVGACGDTFVAMIKRVILLTPIGVGSLVAGSIARAVDVGQVFSALGALLGVVVVAQLVHVFVSDAALYALLTRRNPYRYYIGLPRAWFTAFGTSSSAATLSTTTECVVALGVSEDVARFVLPIGCTVNMDGSALERPITVLWIASVSGVPLSAARQLVVAVTSALLSLGASPIPSAGVSTLVVMIEQASPRLLTLLRPSSHPTLPSICRPASRSRRRCSSPPPSA